MTSTPQRDARAGHLLNPRAPWALLPEVLPRLAAAARRHGDGPVAPPPPVPEAASRRGGGRVAGGVAVIRVSGVISPRGSWLAALFGEASGLVALQEAIDDAATSGDVAGIVLDIDSPGGHVDLLPETAALIREVRATKPVIAVANTMAASAAYWLAAQADEILVTPSGQVGSVGVYIAHEEISRMEDELGITTTLFKAGRYKADGNAWEPLSDSAREELQANVDHVYGMFTADVAAGRGTTDAKVRGDYGEGRMFYAADAIERGMADAVGSVEDAVLRVTGGNVGSKARAIAPTPSSPPRGGGDTQQDLEQRRRAAAVLLP